MIAIDGGHHKYELANFENKDKPGQIIQFIEKTQAPLEKNGNLITINDGTTNEEVLEMLIHRTQALHTKFPSRENALALTHMETALMWFEKRTRDRKARGVEGKNLA